MKNAARLGANAVPMLHPKKRNAVVVVIYGTIQQTLQHALSSSNSHYIKTARKKKE